MEAGFGEHLVYKIPVESSDQETLTAKNHYIGIDAVAWYVDKDPNWFKKYVTSGVLSITLAGGLEKYEIALGTFTIKDETKIAPIFDRPMLPDRNYRGGPVTFNVSLSGVENDTVLCSILKSAASASLGIASGMVSTATLSGPSKILGEAGQAIGNGVKDLLTDTNAKNIPIFDPNGFESTIQPGEIIGPETYILFHRGTKLDEKELSIKTKGKLIVPAYKNSILKDGAWLLLRIRRTKKYSGVRDWFESEKQFRFKLKNLLDDYHLGMISKEDAMKEFETSATGGKTIVDDLINLRTQIAIDGVISETEAQLRTSGLVAEVRAIKEEIQNDHRGDSQDLLKEISLSLARGRVPEGPVGEAFAQNAVEISMMREIDPKKTKRIKTLVGRSSSVVEESLGRMQNIAADFSEFNIK